MPPLTIHFLYMFPKLASTYSNIIFSKHIKRLNIYLSRRFFKRGLRQWPSSTPHPIILSLLYQVMGLVLSSIRHNLALVYGIFPFIIFCNINGLYFEIYFVEQCIHFPRTHTMFLIETRVLECSNSTLFSVLSCSFYPQLSAKCGSCAIVWNDVCTHVSYLESSEYFTLWLRFTCKSIT